MLAEIAIPAILGIITEGPQDFQVIPLLDPPNSQEPCESLESGNSHLNFSRQRVL